MRAAFHAPQDTPRTLATLLSGKDDAGGLGYVGLLHKAVHEPACSVAGCLMHTQHATRCRRWRHCAEKIMLTASALLCTTLQTYSVGQVSTAGGWASTCTAPHPPLHRPRCRAPPAYGFVPPGVPRSGDQTVNPAAFVWDSIVVMHEIGYVPWLAVGWSAAGHELCAAGGCSGATFCTCAAHFACPYPYPHLHPSPSCNTHTPTLNTMQPRE